MIVSLEDSLNTTEEAYTGWLLRFYVESLMEEGVTFGPPVSLDVAHRSLSLPFPFVLRENSRGGRTGGGGGGAVSLIS